MTDRVYMVWDIYDEVRSGIADYAEQPYYFNCLFNEESQEFSNNFELIPIDEETLMRAQEQWAIYRAWELRFHSGLEAIETHPGHSGVNHRYDELEEQIQSTIQSRRPSMTVHGTFSAKKEQPELPFGCVPEMEVEWR